MEVRQLALATTLMVLKVFFMDVISSTVPKLVHRTHYTKKENSFHGGQRTFPARLTFSCCLWITQSSAVPWRDLPSCRAFTELHCKRRKKKMPPSVPKMPAGVQMCSSLLDTVKALADSRIWRGLRWVMTFWKHLFSKEDALSLSDAQKKRSLMKVECA